MKRGLCVWLMCAAIILAAGCGKEKDVIATVGSEKITTAQFAERYRQYMSNMSQRDNIVLREQILNNMINEKLIYQELTRQGFDADSLYKAKMADATDRVVLMSYARTLVSDTSSIPENEVYNEFHAFNSKVTARYLYAKTEAGAKALKRRLEKGETFQALAKEVFDDPGLADNGGDLGTFGWGDMEAPLEDAAFSVPVGTISDPVRLSMGYAIVKVEHRVENQFVTQADYMKVREKLWRRVVEKKFDAIIRSQLEQIESTLHPAFTDSAVGEVFKAWTMFSHEGNQIPPIESVGELKDVSRNEFVRFANGHWTVADFVQRLGSTSIRQRNRVRQPQDVKSIAIGLATREILLQKAKDAGLASDPTVQEGIRHEREAFLLKRWDASIVDTVGSHGWDESVLRKKYDETKASRMTAPEVNVAEILLRTNDEANRVMAKLRKGADFGSLARTYSIRRWAAERNGELGFGSITHYGPMGKKFFAARVGDIVGPDKVDPYIGIFKILETRGSRPVPFDEARESIIGEVKQERQMDTRKSALAHLREKGNFTINSELLANVVVH
jgi:parvulin-like peptidyl-prolyl isomerase